MKKILLSIAMLSIAVFPASASSKIKAKKARPSDQPAYINHSKDVAYSAKWADQAVSPAPGTDFTLGSPVVGPYLKGKTWYYGLNDFTVHGYTAVNMNAPYNGEDAPSWDGPVRNNYRNIRAYNESEPLPSNAGSRRGR